MPTVTKRSNQKPSHMGARYLHERHVPSVVTANPTEMPCSLHATEVAYTESLNS